MITPPAVTGTPQAFAFTASGTVLTYTGGGTDGGTTYDVLCINSDNVVDVPGWTKLRQEVNFQGAYLYARPGGTTTATVDLGNGIASNTSALWLRITNTAGLDVTTGTQAFGDSTSTPVTSTGALATATELVLAFAALHNFTTIPTAPTWSTGFTPQISGSSGTGGTAAYGNAATKTPAGTAAESPQFSWTGPAFDRYILVAAFSGADTGAEAGTVTAALPALQAAATGTASATGAVAAGLPPLTASASGVASSAGTVSSALPALTATILGQAAPTGLIAATLPRLTAAIVGVTATATEPAGYADPELMIAEWLHQQIGSKVWTSSRLPPNERFVAPLTHVLRASSPNDLALTLDDVLLDVDTYSADEDTCREVSRQVWNAMVFTLPLTTFPNGVFVTRCTATPPVWAPDPSVYRRTAAYRVILHGVVDG